MRKKRHRDAHGYAHGEHSQKQRHATSRQSSEHTNRDRFIETSGIAVRQRFRNTCGMTTEVCESLVWDVKRNRRGESSALRFRESSGNSVSDWPPANARVPESVRN